MFAALPRLVAAEPAVPGWSETSNGLSSCQHSRVEWPSWAPMAVTFSLSGAAAGIDSPTSVKADENTWATRIVAANEPRGTIEELWVGQI